MRSSSWRRSRGKRHASARPSVRSGRPLCSSRTRSPESGITATQSKSHLPARLITAAAPCWTGSALQHVPFTERTVCFSVSQHSSVGSAQRSDSVRERRLYSDQSAAQDAYGTFSQCSQSQYPAGPPEGQLPEPGTSFCPHPSLVLPTIPLSASISSPSALSVHSSTNQSPFCKATNHLLPDLVT